MIKYPFENQEIILVDNLSNDGTVEMVKREFPMVKLILPNNNLGFSLANNEGLLVSTGDYILLLNPDTEVYENTLKIIVNQLQLNEANLLAPKLINPDGSLQISFWKRPIVFDSFLELFFLNTIIKRNKYSIYPNKNFIVDSASGAALAFSRNSYEIIGGLDPILFWMEDSDLCERYRLAGRCVLYIPDAVVMHIGGVSSKKNQNKVISNQLLSRLKYFKKHKNRINFYFLVFIVFLHIISRIIIFNIFFLFNKTQKAKAYQFSLLKFFRYLIKNDLTT